MIAAGQAMVTGVIPAKVAVLTEGVLKAMLLSKLKTAMLMVLLAGAVTGSGLFVLPSLTAAQGEIKNSPVLPTQAKSKDSDLLKAMKDLEGTWIVVRHEEEGKDHTQVFKNVDYKLVIENGKFIEKNRNQTQLRCTILIDSTKEPKTIDFLVGEDPGRRNLSIYELLGNDLLVICESFPGEPRPTEFKTTPKSKRYLTVYQRESLRFQQKGENASESPEEQEDVATSQEVRPPKAAEPCEYVIRSRLLEAGADGPKEVLCLPKVTVDDGQLAPVHITDGPQNLLAKVVDDEQIKIGIFFDVRVRRLWGNKARLILSFQRNEVEKSSVSEIRVLGNSLQAIQDVELHKPVKIALQKDATGSAQRWVEITVDGQIIPVPAPGAPQQKGGKK
jgi:uncharacterized protein (TIGR03067 family)